MVCIARLNEPTPGRIKVSAVLIDSRSEEIKIFGGLETRSRFYFVHSFCMQILEDGSKYAIAHHGQTFVAAIESGRVFGTQFHPEKSQKNGLKVLQNFLNL